MSKRNKHVHISGALEPKKRKGDGAIADADNFPLVSTSQAIASQKMNSVKLERARKDAAEKNTVIDMNLSDDHRAMLHAMRKRGNDLEEDHPMNHITPSQEDGQERGLKDDMTVGDVADAVFDALYDQRYHKPQPQWRGRESSSQDNWSAQIEELADSFLKWKGSKSKPVSTEIPTPQASPSDCPPPLEFDIVVIDMYTLETSLHVVLPQSARAAPYLTALGFLPTSPVNPSIAISLKTLQFYEYLRRRKPSFGVEPFTKVLCDLYGRPFRRRWSKAFTDTFEIYLSILRVIENRVSTSLGRNTENWRVLHSCPACLNELVDEPPLLWRILFAIDGNNSLKRLLDRGQGDLREFHSDYIIPIPEVNECDFKAPVPVQVADGGAAPAFHVNHDSDLDGDWEDVEDGDNSPRVTSECVKNWKAAQSDTKKKVLGYFDETGVFAAACRHGILLWVTDMVKSGEQFKYPLSIVKRALNVLGDRLMVGYDIGCTFGVSIANSPLGPQFQRSGSRCCVNAYHGYAHNFQCQVQNHPNNIEGVGLEDFETMERYFSGSNAVAPLVRHGTKYRRRLFMDLYFKQADADKYLALGDFLLGNYRQASDIIETDGKLLQEIMSAENITADDLDRWQVEQREYFQSTLGRQSDESVYRVAYVELLQEHEKTRGDASAKSMAFLQSVPKDWNTKTYQSSDSETRRLETARRRAKERFIELDFELQQMEVALNIRERWTPWTAEYRETLQYMHEHRYHRALENLQRLVVQRLFELHRLNLSGVGYKARTLLADAMRKRSRAIKSAVEKYNAAVLSLGRSDTLDWERASKYCFVEEFELLKVSRADLSEMRWKEPIVREAMKKHQRVKRAREELERVSVEMLRVYSYMASDEEELEKQLNKMSTDNDPLRPMLDEMYTRRLQVNAVIRRRLVQITKLPKYAGPDLVRKRKKGEANDPILVSAPQARASAIPIDTDEDEVRNDEEEDEAQVGGVVDFIADLING